MTSEILLATLRNINWRRIGNKLLQLGIGFVIVDFATHKCSDFWCKHKIVKQLERGTKLELPHEKYVCNRKRLINYYQKFILRPQVNCLFQVVVGPLGCGKSWIVKSSISKQSKGIIYVDASYISMFPMKLANAINMTLDDKPSIFESIRTTLSVVNRKPVGYHLPKGHIESLEYVLNVLEECAMKYKKKAGVSPTLVVDTMDFIAKTNDSAFRVLMATAKRFVDDRVLNIVFVSSEGHVLPMLENFPEMLRAARIHQVPDIDLNEAKNILEGNHFSKPLADEVSKMIGGRLIYLVKSIRVFEDVKALNNAMESDPSYTKQDELHEIKIMLQNLVEADLKRSKVVDGEELYEIKVCILQFLANRADMQANITELTGNEIKKCISRFLANRGPGDMQANITEPTGNFTKVKDTEVREAVIQLVKGNFLCLNVNNDVSFQTKLHSQYVKERWPVEL